LWLALMSSRSGRASARAPPAAMRVSMYLRRSAQLRRARTILSERLGCSVQLQQCTVCAKRWRSVPGEWWALTGEHPYRAERQTAVAFGYNFASNFVKRSNRRD
jgi:hypothetical protein